MDDNDNLVPDGMDPNGGITFYQDQRPDEGSSEGPQSPTYRPTAYPTRNAYAIRPMSDAFMSYLDSYSASTRMLEAYMEAFPEGIEAATHGELVAAYELLLEADEMAQDRLLDEPGAGEADPIDPYNFSVTVDQVSAWYDNPDTPLESKAAMVRTFNEMASECMEIPLAFSQWLVGPNEAAVDFQDNELPAKWVDLVAHITHNWMVSFKQHVVPADNTKDLVDQEFGSEFNPKERARMLASWQTVHKRIVSVFVAVVSQWEKQLGEERKAAAEYSAANAGEGAHALDVDWSDVMASVNRFEDRVGMVSAPTAVFVDKSEEVAGFLG